MKAAVRLGVAFALLVAILASRPASAGRAWTQSGPPGASALAVDPDDSRRIFATVPSPDVATSEIFVSSDSGASWRDVGSAGLSVTEMAAGPSGTIYAAGFENQPGDLPVSIAAVWKSVDSGASWRAAYRSGFCNNVQVLAASPVDPPAAYLGDNVICHGFGGSLFGSVDGSATWNDVSPPLPPDPPLEDFQPVAGFAIAPSDPQVLYLLQRGAWRSKDAGASWVPIADPLDGLGIDFGFDSLAVDAVSSGLVYAIAGHQVVRSLDSGATWQATPLSGDIRQLVTDPMVPDFVAARSENVVFVSSDRGMTWRALSPISVPINDLAVGGGRIYVATANGVFTFHDVRVAPIVPVSPGAVIRGPSGLAAAGMSPSADVTLAARSSTAASGRWAHVGPVRPAFPVAVDPEDPLRVFTAGEGPGVFVSHDGGARWMLAPTPGFVVHDLAVGAGGRGRLLATGAETASPLGSGDNGVWASDDEGASWHHLYDAGPCLEGHPGCPTVSLVAHPRVSGLVFLNPVLGNIAGLFSTILKSVDGGETWRNVPEPSETSATVSLAVNAQNPNVCYSGNASFEYSFTPQMFRTEDGGSTWNEISLVDGYGAFALETDPSDPLTVYASGNDFDGLFRTSDGGLTWTSTGLPPPTRAAIDPTLPGVVFAWSLDRVWRSSDRGVTWAELPPTGSPVHDLAASNGRIYLATDAGVLVFEDVRIVSAVESPAKLPSVRRAIHP